MILSGILNTVVLFATTYPKPLTFSKLHFLLRILHALSPPVAWHSNGAWTLASRIGHRSLKINGIYFTANSAWECQETLRDLVGHVKNVIRPENLLTEKQLLKINVSNFSVRTARVSDVPAPSFGDRASADTLMTKLGFWKYRAGAWMADNLFSCQLVKKVRIGLFETNQFQYSPWMVTDFTMKTKYKQQTPRSATI